MGCSRSNKSSSLSSKTVVVVPSKKPRTTRTREKRAEKELEIYKEVVRLEEMHEAYEEQLRDAEVRLAEAYGSAVVDLEKEEDEVNILNEEVVRILEAESGVAVKRVELSGRHLRCLREASWSIPDSIAGLEKLEQLHVSCFLLVSLPNSVGLLLNLRVLNVSGNKLDALPKSIACCRYLDVHFNELRGLPYAIGRLTTHEMLNLTSNFSDLTELPESIGDQTNLWELDLRNNQIQALTSL
ncbi:hypothetical protein L3X38_040933 [Prunus dulcis]|uniref:Uncharacterized protein n=1 Tax=Prunus dulcis TaxID=3755 RepID=A0AAD4URB6_PRUDU|nr:hypothetical protein L3X38_040933 [Prunus dulcis]